MIRTATVIPVQANHRLYTEYHERILKAVDTCLPVEKVCSIDEMACRLMGTERQVPAARELARHDDQVDSTAQFLDWFKKPMSSYSIFELYRRQAEELQRQRSFGSP